MKQAFNTGFAEIAVSKRKIKQEFFRQISTIINWDIITLKLNRLYAKGQSHTSRMKACYYLKSLCCKRGII